MDCGKSELDLFHPHCTQRDIKRNSVVGLKPLNTLENSTVLEFIHLADSENLRDLYSIYLELTIRVVKQDGSKFTSADTDQPSVSNNILSTLFSKISLFLNEVNVSPNNENYSYRSIIETLFNYSSDSLNTHLANSMCIMDTPDESGVLSPTDKNIGWKTRAKITHNSASIVVCGRLHVDLLNSQLLLLQNVAMRFKMYRSQAEFYMMNSATATPGKVIIEDATLYVKQVEISPSASLTIERRLLLGPAEYHINHVEVTALSIPSGSASYNLATAIQGVIPKYVISGLVSNRDFVGDYKTTPFGFLHQDMIAYALSVNGRPVGQELKFNFNSEQGCTAAYNTLFSPTGNGLHSRTTHLITKNMYYHGLAFICHDLTPDSDGVANHSSPKETGNVRIELTFNSPLTKSCNLIIYAVYPSTIFIDQHRTVTLPS